MESERSSTSSFIAEFADLLPRSPPDIGLQTISLERSLAKPEGIAPLAVGDYPAKPLFDEGLEGYPLSLGHLASLFK